MKDISELLQLHEILRAQKIPMEEIKTLSEIWLNIRTAKTMRTFANAVYTWMTAYVCYANEIVTESAKEPDKDKEDQQFRAACAILKARNAAFHAGQLDYTEGLQQTPDVFAFRS